MVQKARITQLIEKTMREKGLPSIRQASLDSGINHQTLHRIVKGFYISFDFVTARKLADWLGVEINDLLEPAEEDVAEGLGVATSAV